MPIKTAEIAGHQVAIIDTGSARGDLCLSEIDERFRNILAVSYGDPNERPVLVSDNGRERRIIGNGVFSDQEMKVALAIGHIICDPTPRLINNSSMDVTIGHYFYHAGTPDNDSGLFNPFDIDDTHRYFGIKDPEADYMEAKPWADVRSKLGDKALANFGDLEYLQGIPEEHPIILLRPGERILAHTQEFVGILPPGTSSMQARSTTGRIGMSACYCAGWGDSGFINRWAMEVQNLNENEHLPVPVGLRIAQMIFRSTGPVHEEYSKASGNYQSFSGSQLAEIKKDWHPYSLIPRAYRTEIIPPSKVEGLSGGLR